MNLGKILLILWAGIILSLIACWLVTKDRYRKDNNGTICIDGKLYHIYEYNPSKSAAIPLFLEDGRRAYCKKE